MTVFARIRPRSSARGLKAFVVVVCLTILGLEGWRDWSEREQEIAKISADAMNLAKSLVQHAEDSFEVADALLVDAVERVETGGSLPDVIGRLDAFLVERVQSLQRIKSLSIYGEDGLLLSSSLPGHRGRVNGRNEPFFQHHLASSSSDLYLGPLIRDPLGGDWVLTLSRRISKPDGSFGGVAQASIPPRYFANFFGRIDVGSQGVIALFHKDGTLLSRYPYQERAVGTSGSHAPWLKDAWTSGSYEYVSPFDGLERIGGFQRNHAFPIGVLASFGRDEALARWNSEFLFHVGVIALLVITIGSLGWGLAGELRRREEAEVELTLLADTDGLTGLANRRTFDKRLELEWLRAARDGTPLSLLLIDVDQFKAYNDVYGHQAGDRCLKIVAQVFSLTVNRPGDLVARYGGEEIAILLPDTDPEGAAVVAENIRARTEALALRHDANPPLNVLTISIGGATSMPAFEVSRAAANELVAMADQALYRAKTAGRNRVATAEAA
jgi:diguanylate cyclase (GGDEF)-like protein